MSVLFYVWPTTVTSVRHACVEKESEVVQQTLNTVSDIRSVARTTQQATSFYETVRECRPLYVNDGLDWLVNQIKVFFKTNWSQSHPKSTIQGHLACKVSLSGDCKPSTWFGML